ncbi:MAG: DUF4923 family protein [Prevotella sp.]|nr:DUF4923 family protein [Prevotella sp.]
MKKTIMAFAAGCIMLASCGGTGASLLSGILGGDGSGLGTVGGVLSSVLGLDKLSAAQLVGTWRYSQPGCAFTSDNLLAQAGGEVAASQIKSKLASVYSSVGVSSSNTAFQFDQSGQFAGKLMGVPLSGTYTYDPSSGQISMKATLITLNGYIKGTTNGIALLFEGSKLLSIMQTVASMSGNGTLSAIGELSKNYNGLRLGFDMSH